MVLLFSTFKFMNGFELELSKIECWFIDIIFIVFVEMFGDFLKIFFCNWKVFFFFKIWIIVFILKNLFKINFMLICEIKSGRYIIFF